MTRITTRLLVATLASAAMLLVVGASAEANWGPPTTTDSSWHCGGYNKEQAPVWFQECIVVTPGSSGAYVQSIMAASNLGSTSVGLYGETWTAENGATLTDSDCGYVVIAAGARRWCWGATSAVAHGEYVQGEGWLQLLGGAWHYAWSPTVST